jgi:amino acid adenylation domain-containing protein/natural product biosynthesis luciferase-like monooxygenase protein/thioester reductase-like protein
MADPPIRRAATLVDVLREAAAAEPAKRAYTALPDRDGTDAARLTYEALERRARGIAALLADRGAAGERALLVFPEPLEFVAAFFGCLYAGVTAVPVYPPPPGRPEPALGRLAAIARDCGARVGLASAAVLAKSREVFAAAPGLEAVSWLAADEAEARADAWRDPGVRAETVAFLQYTSGSTGSPKGVVLTHASLVHNVLRTHVCLGTDPGLHSVFWLPLFHDMGLIGGVLGTAGCGGTATLMTPGQFLARPLRWLEEMARTRAGLSFAPSFAYDLCVRRSTPEERAALDLRAWEIAGNGAEPISAEALERFAAAFAPSGFRREAFWPAYGLAEGSLMVASAPRSARPVLAAISAEALGRGLATPLPRGEAGARVLVGCGRAASGEEIAIVDPASGARLEPGRVGEIWVASPSIGAGYFGRKEETERTFGATLAEGGGRRFLRTGDLGFLEGGELFVTGRLKDVLVVRGRNHYPQDIERTAEGAHPALRAASSAAFSVEVEGEERLVVAAEVAPRSRDLDAAGAVAAIRGAVVAAHGLATHAVLLVEPGGVPKTSSGKVRRRACREAFLAGTLPLVEASLAAPAAPAPPDPVAEALAADVARLLGRERARVPLDAPLTTLGLDSLLMVELKARIAAAHGLELPIESFLGDVTIAGLAARIGREAGARAAETPARPAPAACACPALAPVRARAARRPLRMSLFYFSSNAAEHQDRKYRLLLDGARFADENGFEAVWVPERHFHAFGGLFPNPAVLGAALAARTQRVRIRAGSVVLPLHSPIRVAEEWAVVDNLAGGRVDLAFATGWNANDFAVRPSGWARRKQDFEAGIEAVRRLWRGEAVAFPNGEGVPFELRVYPLPMQKELTAWVTAAKAEETFEQAGRIGANVLTNMLLQSLDDVARKIAIFRRARAAAGHDPEAGRATLMVHTFLGDSVDLVREQVRGPFSSYIESSVELWRSESTELAALDPQKKKDLIAYAFERYSRTSALFGTPDSCLEMVERARDAGVDEIACLIDFGASYDAVMRSLHLLNALRERCERAPAPPAAAPAAPLARPLSSAEERLFFLDRLHPGTPAYNEWTALRVEGPLDRGAWQRALGAVFRRHEALRTSYRLAEGEPAAHLAPEDPPPPLAFADLSAIAAEQREDEARRLAIAAIREPFDLARAPLVRALLVSLSPREHVFVLAGHHIVLDGFSQTILLGELAAAYEAIRDGRPEPFSGPAPSFAEHARRERAAQAGPAAEEGLAYWRRRLAGAEDADDLPLDRPRPAAPRFRGGRVGLALAPPLVEALTDLARREGATLYATLLAGLAALLHRVGGRTDILIGTPVANRGDPAARGAIGCFVNTVVARCDVSAAPSFRELLRRTAAGLAGDLGHEGVPFERVLGAARPGGKTAPGGLFRVMLAFQNLPLPPLAFAGLSCSLLELDPGAAKLDVRVELRKEAQGGLAGALEYDADLFERARIERMAGHLANLLGAAAAAPDRAIAELEILSPDERRVIVEEWNATARDWGAPQALHELVERQADRTPDAVAVSFEGAAWTYRELDRRASALAERLRGRGVGPDVLVGVAMERSLELVLALLAVLKAGGAYVALDPAYPRARLAAMMEDARAPVLLTQGRLAERLPPCAGETILLEAGDDSLARAAAARPRNLARPDGLAYVIFTSGSTGRPKGVMVPHAGIVNRILWMQAEYGMQPGDRVLQKTPYSFDVSLWEFFWPLATGARLVMAQPGGHQDPAYLVRTIAEEGITHLHFVPSMLQAFLEARGVERCTGLRQVFASGEALSAELAQRFFERLPADLVNLYGPTEASVDVTHWRCERRRGARTVPIGRPIANTQIYVLDAARAPVPVGVAGELYIGGVGLARGYLGRPDLTAAAFVPDPFRGEPGARLYRTGDLARFLPDGNVEYLGRVDHQVKIRGVRVELAEVEAALLEHPAVREAVAAAQPDGHGGKRIAAYVTARGGAAPSAAALRAHAAARLPDAMVPSAFAVLAAIPLTPSGKADRRALPPIDGAAPPAAEPAPPRVRMEDEIAAIVAEVLRLPRVGAGDDFFALGGHSLLAIRLAARLGERFGVEVPVRAIFAAPTPALLAEAIARLRAGGSAEAGVDALDADATPPPLEAAPRRRPPARGRARLFLTGGTGFLGAFLLRELLERTDAQVLCLVRAAGPADGLAKILAALERHGLAAAGLAPRIVPIAGDLAAPRLGLAEDAFRDLAERTDAIYHVGATVNFVAPYAALRAPNVLGTREVVRLAASAARKPLHYVSSVAVFEAEGFPAGAAIAEAEDLSRGLAPDGGYARSKWVAERLVARAREQGLPVAIYRPGRVSGESRTGAANPTDLLARILRVSIELESAPDLEALVDMTPVDYVARAIAHLASREASLGGTFHLVNPAPIHAASLVQWLRGAGYPLRRVGFAAWREGVARLAASAPEHPANELLPLLFEKAPDGTALFETLARFAAERRFDCRGALEGLAGSGIACPPVDAALLRTTLDGLLALGALPPPGRAEGARRGAAVS